MAVTLYLLTDDVEEFIVVAADRNDLFRVIEEGAGASTADELAASSRVYEYPPEFVLPTGQTAGEVVAKEGRGVVGYNPLDGGGPVKRFPKPPVAAV